MRYTVDKVFTAPSNFNGDKALGLDGFMLAFWQFSWEIVKADIMRMFKEFFETGKFVKNLNTTFLVLVLKKGGAEDFKDIRLISLVGSLYKLLVEVLANRLKMVMHRLINRAQNTFVEERQIMNASLLVNEVIDSMLKRKEKGALCKLDIEKGYDKIKWNCIIKVLQKMGFGAVEKQNLCF